VTARSSRCGHEIGKYTPGRIGLGHVFNAEKKPEEALKEYSAAIEQNPRSQSAIGAKVATLLRQNKVNEAVAFAQAAVKAEPKNAATHEILGRLYARKGDLKAAEKEAGAPVKVTRFVRYALGEGIDKKDTDFAAEVAAAAAKR